MSSSSASPKPQQQHKSPSNFAMRPPDQQGLKCPRCDSPNTKFCYYNNYSLSQPRHFCKTCRRYWTKGGALRNVPVGGGCRKPKKSRSAIPASNPAAAAAASSAAEFQFGTMLPINQFVGFNYPIAAINGDPLMFNANVSIVSSIESLSSMNQDLHWKLQQQRLAILFAGGGGEAAAAHHESNKMIEPVSFHQAAETAANYNNSNTSEWINGVQAWADHHMPQFSALP